jgi:8-oxo-dGTP diphosphatase
MIQKVVPFSFWYTKQMSKRFKIIPEVVLLLIKDGKVLLLRRQNTGWNDGQYCPPAGHAEDLETVREASAREAMEEVGIKIKPEDLEFAHVQHRWNDDHSRVGFYFVAKHYEGEPYNAEPEKCDELEYFPLDNLPANTIAPFKFAIECYAKGISYSEFGWEEK